MWFFVNNITKSLNFVIEQSDKKSTFEHFLNILKTLDKQGKPSWQRDAEESWKLDKKAINKTLKFIKKNVNKKY